MMVCKENTVRNVLRGAGHGQGQIIDFSKLMQKISPISFCFISFNRIVLYRSITVRN